MAKPFNRFPGAVRALLVVESRSEKDKQFCGGLAYRAARFCDKGRAAL